MDIQRLPIDDVFDIATTKLEQALELRTELTQSSTTLLGEALIKYQQIAVNFEQKLLSLAEYERQVHLLLKSLVVTYDLTFNVLNNAALMVLLLEGRPKNHPLYNSTSKLLSAILKLRFL